MKLNIEFEEKNPMVSMSRFEGTLKIGETLITQENFFKMMLFQTPVRIIMEILVKHKIGDLYEYLNGAEGIDDEGLEFILTLLTELNCYEWDTEQLNAITPVILERIPRGELPLNILTESLNILIREIRYMPPAEEYSKILSDLLHYFLGARDENSLNIQRELLKTIFRYITNIKEKKVLDEWILNYLPNVDSELAKKELEKASTKERLFYSFSKVPKNCSFMSSSSDGVVYFYEIPKSKIRVKFHDVAFEDVGHPRLLFAIYERNGRVFNVKLAAIKGKGEITQNTPLYNYPYSNVHNSGKICWSGYSDLEIDQIPMMFLSTSNNSHLNDDTYELFKTYQGKTFPDNKLKRLEGSTVKDWC